MHLKKAHSDAYSDYECEEAAKFGRIFCSEHVNYYRDDRFVEVAVRAFMEHNLPLMRDTMDAWEVYNDAMKPFYRYQRQYEELRQMKRENKARRLNALAIGIRFLHFCAPAFFAVVSLAQVAF